MKIRTTQFRRHQQLGLVIVLFLYFGLNEKVSAQITPKIPTRYPLPEALDSLKSDEKVEVLPRCLTENCVNGLADAKRGIVFHPRQHSPEVGVVFYPGGKVDPRAYAPIVNALASSGVLSIIVPMPDNLSFLGVDRFQDVVTEVPSVKKWYLVGHSLGGSSAVRYAKKNPQEIAGLVLWGAYIKPDNDLSEVDIPVTSIYGLRDGVSTPEEIEEGKPFLPDNTQYIPLPGANHAQFGTYGSQDGDLAATITLQKQQQLTVAATLCAIGLGKENTCAMMGFETTSTDP